MDDTKKCTGCGELRKLSEFSPDRRNRDGRRGECGVCTNEYARVWYAKLSPEDRKDRRLRKSFGITYQDFISLLKTQNNTCPVCALELVPGRDTVVDHNHKTGKVRGLLHRDCNSGIGLLGDNFERLHRAARYLFQSVCEAA